MTQKQQVIKYFKENKNEAKHFKTIANDLNILVPNMRRILGQGTLKGIFERVSKGVYKLNNEDNLSMNTANKLNDKLANNIMNEILYKVASENIKNEALNIIKKHIN